VSRNGANAVPDRTTFAAESSGELRLPPLSVEQQTGLPDQRGVTAHDDCTG
jgi:hypothetical protein